MVEQCDTALYQINSIIAKFPRRAPAIENATAASKSSASEANSETEPKRKPIAPYLTLPIWAWFLISIGLVILLAWLFG